MKEFAELDKRLSVHEAQCVERYDAILKGMAFLKVEVNKITTRTWAAMVWLVVALLSTCATLLWYILTHGA